MKNKNLLFIVEGKNDEPRFLELILRKCYPFINYKIFSYEANLHMLASRLEKDYEDFEEDELDILLFLKSYEQDEEKKKLFSMKYTDVFLIFDFEPQHPDKHYETIRKMLIYFNSSEDHGKLFINYPMMQSYRHLKSLPDINFFDSVVINKDFTKYKEIVSRDSFNNDVSSYDYPTIIALTYHHLMKAIKIQNNELLYPTYEDYEKIDYSIIFNHQYDNLSKGFVSIVNTCILILIGYKAREFFEQIQKHDNTFELPLLS